MFNLTRAIIDDVIESKFDPPPPFTFYNTKGPFTQLSSCPKATPLALGEVTSLMNVRYELFTKCNVLTCLILVGKVLSQISISFANLKN